MKTFLDCTLGERSVTIVEASFSQFYIPILLAAGQASAKLKFLCLPMCGEEMRPKRGQRGQEEKGQKSRARRN